MPGEQLAQFDNPLGSDHQLLFLHRKVKRLDMNQVRIRGSGFFESSNNIDLVDTFLIRGWLLTDKPLESRQL